MERLGAKTEPWNLPAISVTKASWARGRARSKGCCPPIIKARSHPRAWQISNASFKLLALFAPSKLDSDLERTIFTLFFRGLDPMDFHVPEPIITALPRVREENLFKSSGTRQGIFSPSPISHFPSRFDFANIRHTLKRPLSLSEPPSARSLTHESHYSRS